jgi:menaquinone-dependent protoporphyrinogen IX oxidase
MGTIVVYKSISGFTKKYAGWIAEELGLPCVELGDFRRKSVADGDVVVFGGSLHAVGINGYRKFSRLVAGRKLKQLVVFAVGATPARDGVEELVRTENFPGDEGRNIRLYYLRGGFDYGKLDWSNRLLMQLLKARLKLRKQRGADEEGMLKAYDRPLDVTKKENVAELVAYVKGLGS